MIAVQESIIDSQKLFKAITILKSIRHPLRQRIMNFLMENGATCVTDIRIKMNIEQSVVSQHLAILRGSKIVTTERQGKVIYYTLDIDRLSHIEHSTDVMIE